jgi:hypothetical protein
MGAGFPTVRRSGEFIAPGPRVVHDSRPVCTSIAIAIYSKSAWSFADIRVVGARPYMGYAAAAAAAVVAAFVIQLLLRFVRAEAFCKFFPRLAGLRLRSRPTLTDGRGMSWPSFGLVKRLPRRLTRLAPKPCLSQIAPGSC